MISAIFHVLLGGKQQIDATISIFVRMPAMPLTINLELTTWLISMIATDEWWAQWGGKIGVIKIAFTSFLTNDPV